MGGRSTFYPAVAFALSTGARLGEIMAMRIPYQDQTIAPGAQIQLEQFYFAFKNGLPPSGTYSVITNTIVHTTSGGDITLQAPTAQVAM